MKAYATAPPAVGGSPIQSVLLAKRMGPRPKGFRFNARSLPGHLIQLMRTGVVDQACNGRQYHIRPGMVVWYHEDETVTGSVRKGPWTFYSVNFIAPTLPPPSFDQRVFTPRRNEIETWFAGLVDAWDSAALPTRVREFRVHAALLRILSLLHVPRVEEVRMDPHARLWWEIETRFRQDISQPVTMRKFEEWSHRSPATIARSCEHAVGVPPMKRIKQVRMSLARGLVRNSDLPLKDIAEQVGYGRIHEFSRYYRKHQGVAPSADRIRKL